MSQLTCSPANPIPEAATIGTCRLIPIKRLFTDTQVWTGSSSSAAAADPYVAARDAAIAPTTDDDDSPTPKETAPSEPRGSPPQRERQANARDKETMNWGQGGAPAARELIVLDARKVKFAAVILQGTCLDEMNFASVEEGQRKEHDFIGSKPISLNEAVRMAHALMEQKSQARIERIAEGNKSKLESHMAQDCKGKAIATGANTRPTVTCYDCGEKGHTRNYCPKKRDPQGHQLFVAHVTEKELKEKRLEDVPVIRDFPKVFPDDLPGLPPPRQVEFKIELVPGVAPVATDP
ncbi:putative reverse transcriptase domain-containing protein [Tanacetum coccineum]